MKDAAGGYRWSQLQHPGHSGVRDGYVEGFARLIYCGYIFAQHRVACEDTDLQHVAFK